MMVLAFVPFLLEMPALAVFVVPVFLSALLGVSFKREKKTKVAEDKKILYPNINPEFLFPRAA